MFRVEANFFIGPYPARTDDLLLVREALWPTELTARELVGQAPPCHDFIGGHTLHQEPDLPGGRADQFQSTSGSRSKTSAAWWMQSRQALVVVF